MEALYTLGSALVFVYACWVLYVLVMGFYRAKLAGRLSPGAYVLAFPWVVIGVVFDVVLHYTLGTLLFVDLPRKGEHLLTKRLQRYMAGDGWRRKWADWICTHLLDPFDPDMEHC